MNVWKKFVVVFTLVLAVAGIMAQQAFSAEKEPVTIKVMNWSQEQVEFYKEVVAEFQKEYDWITVDWQTLAEKQYREALPLMFQSGDAPDIFHWISQGVRELTAIEAYDLGWAAPLGPNDEITEEFLARWPEGSFLEGSNIIDGKYYSFPFNDNKIWGPGYMYYNKAVFRAAGLDPEAPPTTWNELYEACKAIKDKAGTYCLSSPLKPASEMHRTWLPLVGSISFNNDGFFDLKKGRFAADDPTYLAVFDFIRKLYNEDLLIPGLNEKAFCRAALGSGQAAIYFDGPWIPSVLANMGFEDFVASDLGVAPPPVPDDGPRGALTRTPSENKWYVSSQSKHPEEAWLFIEWMTRPEGFFGTQYVIRGYGPLAFVDVTKYIEEPVLSKIAKEIAPTLRVSAPTPEVACPDLAASKARLEAQNIHRNWEYEEMITALTSGTEYAPVAKKIAEAKNAKFLEVLEAEARALGIPEDTQTSQSWHLGDEPVSRGARCGLSSSGCAS